MSWKISKFASSLRSRFTEVAVEQRTEADLEHIRQAMLSALFEVASTEVRLKVVGQVRVAPTAQALWYLRSDVMTLLASNMGETAAHSRLHDITEMFKGLLAPTQAPRLSPLNRR